MEYRWHILLVNLDPVIGSEQREGYFYPLVLNNPMEVMDEEE